MTTFRPRFQISSIISTRESISNSSLLRTSSLTSTIKENVRNFWFKSQKKFTEHENVNPLRIEPCKGCPSKCLEDSCGKSGKKRRKKFFRLRKASIKEKPSNCLKEKPVKVKLTLWEELFGPDPKRSWPDPCTCRIANYQRKQRRQEDPRLFDSRYQETAGDVFLYTEVLKTCRTSCLEPQPKPPPQFKLPKAVICKMINESCEKKPSDEIHRKVGHRSGNKYLTQQYRIPYEELRPPKQWKQQFKSREGIRSQNVIQSINKELNFAKVLPTVEQVYSQLGLQRKENKLSEKVQGNTSQIENHILTESIGRRSRVEQLKMLVQLKEASQCMLTF